MMKRPLGWIVPALVIWALVFGIYEVLERTLLSGLSHSVLYILHIIRGTGTSFLLAGFVAWYILRRGIPLERPPAWTGAEYLEKRIHWLITLRWMAILGVWATVVMATFVLKVLSPFSAVALSLISLVMVGYNIGFSVLAGKIRAPRAMAFAQVFLDLSSLTLMIHFSGGIENPFFAFFVFHVIIAGIVLQRHEAYFVAGVTCFLFSSLVLLEHFGVIQHHSLLVSALPWASRPAPLYLLGLLGAFVATTMFSAYFATSIMEDLRVRQEGMEEARDLLAQEKQKLDDIVRSIGAGLLVVNQDGRVVFSNEKVREWFGGETGEPCSLKCNQPSLHPGECPARASFGEGRTVSWERTALHNGGRRFFLHTTSPVFNRDGNIPYIIEVIQDITKMKEIEIQLVQAGKMVAVGELASGIAHELNNPLATVAASAELLRNASSALPAKDIPLIETFTRNLRKIEENVFRCKEIIQSLLGFARKEDAGQVNLSVNDLIEETLKLVEERARSEGKRIERVYTNTSPLSANPRQLQQAFLNIIVNALDAIEGHGTVSVKTWGTDGSIAVRISDTGKGIPREHIQKIFDPFFTTKPVGKGTGLGLYLCYQIVESLAGKITVESEEGKGTAFTLTFPARR